MKKFKVGFTLLEDQSGYTAKVLEALLVEFIRDELIADYDGLTVEDATREARPNDGMGTAVADDLKRNYLQEALEIAAGDSLYLAEAEHVRVLASLNTALVETLREFETSAKAPRKTDAKPEE